MAIKGFAEPVLAYEVLRASAAESRFEALHARADAAGRAGGGNRGSAPALATGQGERGPGGAVVRARPGIGKSRISGNAARAAGQRAHARLRYFCSPHHTTSPLHPFISQLERAAGFEPDDSPNTKFDKLEAILAPSIANRAEDAPLLAELLAIPPGGRYQALTLTPRG